MATIYIPGLGATGDDDRKVHLAVNEYDYRLSFRRNEDTGQWCIFLKMLPSEPDLPLFGFDQIPSPEFALESLQKADSLRQGEKILDDMNKKNKELLKPYEEKTETAVGEMAEAFEWAYRKMGSEKVKYFKSFRPIKRGV